jgi:hypothetical protein
LIDGAVVIRLRGAARSQAIEGSQGVLVGGGRVQLASGGQRVLGEDDLRPHDDRGQDEGADAGATGIEDHFFLISTLSRAGVVSVTVTA